MTVEIILLGLVALQIGLGGATWIAKYSWPEWAAGFRSAAGYVIAEKSLSQSLITTAHVAGSIHFRAALRTSSAVTASIRDR